LVDAAPGGSGGTGSNTLHWFAVVGDEKDGGKSEDAASPGTCFLVPNLRVSFKKKIRTEKSCLNKTGEPVVLTNFGRKAICCLCKLLLA
jgi:hypothetical protein